MLARSSRVAQRAIICKHFRGRHLHSATNLRRGAGLISAFRPSAPSSTSLTSIPAAAGAAQERRRDQCHAPSKVVDPYRLGFTAGSSAAMAPKWSPALALALISLLALFHGTSAEFEVAQGAAVVAPQDEDPLDDFFKWVGTIGSGKQEPYVPEVDTTSLLDLSASKKKPKPSVSKALITVAKDGSGDYTTVQDAVDAVPSGNTQRVTIHIKAGVYREKVIIPGSTPFITLKGDGQKKTIIVWGDTASTKSGGKALGTYGSATVAVNSDHFVGQYLTIKNSAPAPAPGAVGEQAVALRLSGDKAALYFVSVIGAQDTLYLHKGYHYISQSYIQGSIDFIFGSARALIQKSHLHSIATTFGSLTAQKRLSKTEAGGFSIVGCVVTGSGSIFLGRAWGPYSRVVYIYTYFADIIRPIGWDDWQDPARQKTVFYGEYACFGPGATTFKSWPKWGQHLTRKQAAPFIGYKFINGKDWLPYLI